ncbi:hypothetical protein [Lactococcus lactis]|uniref:hypothetical protein n=1 Tax=Lactococcus lactis TaxID=1358 RepID=UPI00288D3CA0|nr:hypothetical protein [Lactococcus lactis]MDT2861037.1 hypothetical protein [Lactococcus lactis]MDT2885402.1 hypothetical protein [Lactococcus lactis]MDT2888247.1 hypothetical protein [Lactococcus lactis]MDT2922919.1 hypothetical protein [Lactococcus lactis]MDT2931070.1 hypothetical protein [Lactococcus lactis]
MDNPKNSQFFPDNYDRNTLGLKKKLVRKYNVKDDFSALDISKNAYIIYDWLSERKVENPNASSVYFFDYAAQTLGIPYQLLTESYFTQTQLTEEDLFKHSTKFNAKLNEMNRTKSTSSKIEIPNFNEKIEEYFSQKQISELLKQLLIPGTNLSKSNLKRYNLNWLLSDIIKIVWKNITVNSSSEEQETLKQYFRKYFYKDKQEYSEQFLALTKNKLATLIEKEEVQKLEPDSELLKLLSQENINTDSLNRYIKQKRSSLTSLSFYKQFLVHLSHAFYLSPQNIFLLTGQLPTYSVVKTPLEWKYCEQEINQNAQPIFLFGDDNKSVIPFFDFKDTSGEMILSEATFDTRELINDLKKIYQIDVNFSQYLGDVMYQIMSDHTLMVSAALNESSSFQEIIVGSTGILYKNLSEIEKASVNFCILKSFGIDYQALDEIYKNTNPKKINIEESLNRIRACVDQFQTQISTDYVVNKVETEFESFEEEIRLSKEMEANALSNMQTVKQEKAENKN